MPGKVNGREVSDLEMMQTPSMWPMFRLPVKRRNPETRMMEYGFLLDWSADEYWWFEGKTIYDEVQVTDAKVIRRADLQGLVDAGWLVD